MKYVLIIIFGSICMQLSSQAMRESIEGVYEALTAESCELWEDGGGCMVHSYTVLKFEKDSVSVSMVERVYSATDGTVDGELISNSHIGDFSWIAFEETIKIQQFNEYGVLQIQNDHLISEKNKLKRIEFYKKSL